MLRIELARDAEHVAAALPDLHAALALAEQVDPRTLLRVLYLFMFAARVLGDKTVAEPVCERGRLLAHELDDQAALVRFEAWTGMLAHQRGQVGESVTWGRAAFERAARLDDPQLVLSPGGLLRTQPPGIRHELGWLTDPLEGVPTFDELLSIARTSGDARSLAWLLPSAAAVARHSRDSPNCARWLTEALRRGRAESAWARCLIPLLVTTSLAIDKGEVALAQRLHRATQPYTQVILPSMPPWWAQVHERSVSRLSTHGSAAGGTPIPLPIAVDEALAWTRDLGGAPRGEDVPLSAQMAQQAASETLTEREQHVLSVLTSGASNKELSQMLGISAKTVMHHTSAIYRKLGVRGRAEAVSWALQHERPVSDIASSGG